MAKEKEESANVYIIPKDMIASMQFFGSITLMDIAYLAGFMLVGIIVTNVMQVEGILLTIVVMLFHFVLGVICIHRPITNPDRRFIAVLITVLKDQDKNEYKAIDKHYYNQKRLEDEDGFN
ncbi:DUF5592 family protein [Salinicoccus kekensis]|uniref:PrgI family protein n=1 Tax=Salinicoccus kekensis TaxID=714307 RepID=A0A285UTA6_9STAP|nr:DUF5592 family protein [Salinicoccus kekensis]SOC45062.1 hypothetical protein SAMN05878391_2577 [Salinicoccus kekensis]